MTNVDSLVIGRFSCADEECLGDFKEKLSAWAQQGVGVHRAGREHAEPSCGVARCDFGRPEAAAECDNRVPMGRTVEFSGKRARFQDVETDVRPQELSCKHLAGHELHDYK
ncbi:MAG: hypothetical protein WA435_10400 [Gallionellaceae bacterium]